MKSCWPRSTSSTFLMPQHTVMGQKKKKKNLSLLNYYSLGNATRFQSGVITFRSDSKMSRAAGQRATCINLKSKSVITCPVNYILMNFMQFSASVVISTSEFSKSTLAGSLYRALLFTSKRICQLGSSSFPHALLSRHFRALPVMATAVLRSCLTCDSFVRKLNVFLKTHQLLAL